MTLLTSDLETLVPLNMLCEIGMFSQLTMNVRLIFSVQQT